jgi:GH25 family lysozyme M1 (1,4-beta-N-acetylmuramidase)
VTAAGQFADVSSNNPLPNIAAYKKAGHTHICRKVSEGVGYHWFDGDTFADRCHAAGLHVGHYHWLRPDSSATAQAAYFVTAVKSHLKAGDWLMTDFERTANVNDPGDTARAAQLHAFNTYVAQHLPGYPLYVYTGNWYLDGKPHCQAEVRKWPVVMSDYSGAAVLPNPYRLHYVAWQFTDRGVVPGFGSAAVDYNRWLVQPSTPLTLEALMALDRNSADYRNLVADVANAVWAHQIPLVAPAKPVPAAHLLAVWHGWLTKLTGGK